MPSPKPNACSPSTLDKRSRPANRSLTVPPVGGTFSPLRIELRLDNHSYSPQTLHKITQAAARFSSYADAAYALDLAGIAISSRQVERIAVEIGNEWIEQRQHKVVQRRRRQLPAQVRTPPVVAVVEVDGGRQRTRQAGCGPGVHEPENKENKIACLLNMATEVQQVDPQPEPPEAFLLPRRVQRLVQRLKGQAGEAVVEAAVAGAEPEDEVVVEASRQRRADAERVRSCVASTQDSQAFGPMVAAEAQERNFYQAPRRAFVADGAAYNWTIQHGYFPDFEPIADFMHVLCYIYLAAWGVGSTEAERWSQYLGWLRSCWQGRVDEVIAALQQAQARLGEPPEDAAVSRSDPRKLVAEALSYLRHNACRMDYPRYRRAGLPVTSSLVESLVGEFNARVKDRKKFWNRPSGAEPILQLRAALLSEDGRLARFFASRPGNPYRRRKAG